MNPIDRPLASISRRSLVAASALLAGSGLAACARFSPTQTSVPYLPADGIPLRTDDLDLLNLLVVAAEAGGDGIVVGNAVNTTNDVVDLTFSVGGSASAPTTVPPSTGVSLSEGSARVVVAGMPSAPGGLVDLTVTSSVSGVHVVRVPVLPPTLDYARYARDLSSTA